VAYALHGLTNFDTIAQYIEASLNSFQNLTGEEKTEVTAIIEQYRRLLWPAELKLMALGFAFLNIAGEENFDEVVRNVRVFLDGLPTQVATPPAVSPQPGIP
jgi:hypothetical protein